MKTLTHKTLPLKHDHSSFKEAEMKAKKSHHTSFVKSPCPAPALLNVSSVFGYLGFPPMGTGEKKHSWFEAQDRFFFFFNF